MKRKIFVLLIKYNFYNWNVNRDSVFKHFVLFLYIFLKEKVLLLLYIPFKRMKKNTCDIFVVLFKFLVQFFFFFLMESLKTRFRFLLLTCILKGLRWILKNGKIRVESGVPQVLEVLWIQGSFYLESRFWILQE